MSDSDRACDLSTKTIITEWSDHKISLYKWTLSVDGADKTISN